MVNNGSNNNNNYKNNNNNNPIITTIKLTTNTTTYSSATTDSSVTAAVTTTNNNQQPPTTTTNKITNYPSKRMKPLHFNRILNSQLIVSFSGSAVVDSETSISGGGGGGGPVKPKPIQKVIRNLGSNKFSLDRVSSIISKFPTSEELASIHKLHSKK
ncbi:hypothetical protein ACTFIW_012558 [Dictyostelium discoideum]